MVSTLSDKLTRLSTTTSPAQLRRARAEAVFQVLPPSSLRATLNLPELASETELTVSQVEAALDDLADAGRIELSAVHGRVRVRRLDAERSAA